MNRIAQLRRGQAGFTLIELLVVVAIIALLATFAMPKLMDAISKSKKAPGQADMQTISGALDRYFMEKDSYPTGTTVDTELRGGFLKATTSFINGYKMGYLYFSDATGSYYVLVDPGSNKGAITVTCDAGAWTATKTALATGLFVIDKAAPADVASCTSADPGVSVVTN